MDFFCLAASPFSFGRTARENRTDGGIGEPLENLFSFPGCTVKKKARNQRRTGPFSLGCLNVSYVRGQSGAWLLQMIIRLFGFLWRISFDLSSPYIDKLCVHLRPSLKSSTTSACRDQIGPDSLFLVLLSLSKKTEMKGGQKKWKLVWIYSFLADPNRTHPPDVAASFA